MPHRKFTKYFEFLQKEFKNSKIEKKKLEVIYRNYDVLCCFVERNFLSVEDVSLLTDVISDVARNKLSVLEKNSLISSTRINRKKFYSSDVPKSLMEEFKRYTVCSRCGNLLGREGGVIHINIASEPKSKIFCTKECMRKWMIIK